MAFEIKVTQTEEARRRWAEAETTGKAYKIVGFTLGNAGHDPLDPTTPLAPDPTLTEAQGVVFGPKAVAGFTYASDQCPVWDCFLDRGEAVTLYSSLYLIAEIVSSPVPGDVEVGTTFLYGICNFAQRPKFDGESLHILVGVQR